MDSDTRVIAVEEHFATTDYFDALERLAIPPDEEFERQFMLNFSRDETLSRQFTDPRALIVGMDAAGIDMSVVSLNTPGVQLFTDAGAACELAASLNDALAERVRAAPSRVAGLGAIAPQDPVRAADEIGRIMGPLGLRGVLIGSHTHGRYLDEAEFEPILAALEQHDAPLYLHPRCPSPAMLAPLARYGMFGALWGFQVEASTHAMRLILSGALDRHPRLRIVLGHLGEALPFPLWRTDHMYAVNFAGQGAFMGMVKRDGLPRPFRARRRPARAHRPRERRPSVRPGARLTRRPSHHHEQGSLHDPAPRRDPAGRHPPHR